MRRAARSVGGATWLSRRPQLRQFDNVLNEDDCGRLRRLASSRMAACDLSEAAHAASHERSSTGCWLPRHDAPPLAWKALGATERDVALVARLETWLAEACGLPPTHGEPPQVLRYRPGQQYDLHPDFFDPRDRESLANGGQRVLTCLIYLSTVPAHAGGATFFPRATDEASGERGLRVQPVAGRAIVLRNASDDGKVDVRSVHAGEPLRRVVDNSSAAGGRPVEKWLVTKWVRRRPFLVDTAAFEA